MAGTNPSYVEKKDQRGVKCVTRKQVVEAAWVLKKLTTSVGVMKSSVGDVTKKKAWREIRSQILEQRAENLNAEPEVAALTLESTKVVAFFNVFEYQCFG